MGFLARRNEKRINRWYFGGLASTAAVMFTHPLDLIKVLLQTQSEKGSLAENVRVVYRTNGLGGFYNGLSASVLRQATYTTSRFAIYEAGKEFVGADTFPKRTMLALVAGAFGGTIGVPMDVVNVRMQNDMKLPMDQRRNYKHVGEGLKLTFQEGGIGALFSGGTFAVTRAVLMTFGQNAIYDEIKGLLRRVLKLEDGFPLHIASSVSAACVATVLTQPMDVVKTRKMSSKPGEFTSNWDVIAKTAREGPLSFFKGIVPAFLRLGPQTILLFIFMEQLRLYFGYLKPHDRND